MPVAVGVQRANGHDRVAGRAAVDPIGENADQILQRVPNNYETDLILPIVDRAAQLAGMQYASAAPSQKTDLKVFTLTGLLNC